MCDLRVTPHSVPAARLTPPKDSQAKLSRRVSQANKKSRAPHDNGSGGASITATLRGSRLDRRCGKNGSERRCLVLRLVAWRCDDVRCRPGRGNVAPGRGAVRGAYALPSQGSDRQGQPVSSVDVSLVPPSPPVRDADGDERGHRSTAPTMPKWTKIDRFPDTGCVPTSGWSAPEYALTIASRDHSSWSVAGRSAYAALRSASSVPPLPSAGMRTGWKST